MIFIIVPAIFLAVFLFPPSPKTRFNANAAPGNCKPRIGALRASSSPETPRLRFVPLFVSPFFSFRIYSPVFFFAAS